jgi:hypothetical protein
MKNLLFILFSINCLAQVPTIEWQKSFGGSDSDYGYSIKQTNDGGYITVGATKSNDAITPGNHHGNYDVYVIKTNNSGNVEWQKTIGGSGYDVGISVIQTLDNGYIISGYTSSNDGDISLNHGLFDSLVIKLDALGNIAWLKTYGGSQNDYAYTIIQTNDGGYMIAGNSNSNDNQVSINKGLLDGWVVKLDALGTIEWEKTFGGTNIEYINSILQTTDNGYIFVGHTYSNDGDVTQNQGNCDAWIVKLNPNGIIEWQKTYGGNEVDFLYAIQQTPDGGYISCGQTESSNGDLSINRGISDAWVLKLNSIGNITWNSTYGGSSDDSLASIIQTPNGDYIMSGATNSNDIDITTNNGESDGWIVKISSIGNLIWQKTLGGSALDGINAMVKTTDNGFSCIGYAFSNNGDVTLNHGSSDLWIIKFAPESLTNNIFQSDKIYLFPNPTTSVLNLQTAQLDVIDKICIIDIFGKIIELTTQSSNQIKTQNLASGTYFIEAIINDKTYHTKFIKE